MASKDKAGEGLSRRDFGAVAAAGLSAVMASHESLAAEIARAKPLDIAEWSYFWVA